MKKYALLIVAMVILSLLLSTLTVPTEAAVVFQDNFNTTTYSDDIYYGGVAYCTQNSPFVNGWSNISGDSATLSGATHYAWEVTSPGRLGVNDRSAKEWWHPSFDAQWYDYGEVLLHYYTSGPQCIPALNTPEVYVRWYMRIPADFNITASGTGFEYQKAWRFVLANGYEIYLNYNGGGSLRNSTMQLYGASGDDVLNMASFNTIADGQWHAHEIRIKTSSPQIKQYWLDGGPNGDYSIPTASATPVNWPTSNIIRNGLGTGNSNVRDHTPITQTPNGWVVGFEYDDYVESTTGPIGLAGGYGDTSAPANPSGLSVR